MAPSGSATVGQAAPVVVEERAGRARARPCTGRRASTSPSVGPSVASFSVNRGNSSRHGTHHDAQKLTMTGLPRSAARSTARPSRAVPVIAGRGLADAGLGARPRRRSAASRRRRRGRASRAAGAGADRAGMRASGLPRPTGRERPRHVRVHRADEGVAARRRAPGHRRHAAAPVKMSPLNSSAPRRVLDRDVVGDAGIPVVEGERERLAGRDRDLRSR